MEWYIYLAVIGVGILVGFINTLAGSGSLLSLPLLIFLGLDANTANGTNRIGILMQSLVATGKFKQQKVFSWKEGIWLSIPAVIGSIIGALFASKTDSVYLEFAIALLLVFMFFILLFKPDKWIKGQAGKVKEKPSFLQIIIFFGIGLYGGFIQAGVGFFLLAGLVLGAGFDLVKANAIKVLIVLLYTPFALGIFMYYNQVDYKLGLILGVGNMIGAYIAAKMSVNWGPKIVRIFLLIAILISAIKLLWGLVTDYIS